MIRCADLGSAGRQWARVVSQIGRRMAVVAGLMVDGIYGDPGSGLFMDGTGGSMRAGQAGCINSTLPHLPARSSLTAADAATPTAPSPEDPTALAMTLVTASSPRSTRLDGSEACRDGRPAEVAEAASGSSGAGVDVTPVRLPLLAGIDMWWGVPSCAGGEGRQGTKAECGTVAHA